MTDERQRKVPRDLRDGLHPEREAGPATVPGAPGAGADRPEFADIRQEGRYAKAPGGGVPQRSPADAAAEAGEEAGSGDRFAVSRVAEQHGRALLRGDVEAAVQAAAPAVRDRLRAQIAELRLDDVTEVTVLRTQARRGGWTVWLQFRGGGDGMTLATDWDESPDGAVLRDLTVAGDGA